MFVLRNVFGQLVGEYWNESAAIRFACRRAERTQLPIAIYDSDSLTKVATVFYDVASCVCSVSFNDVVKES